MAGEHPTVSVAIATYNRSNVLAMAIESVRRQTFEDWELVIVGDACTDDTAEVVAAFEDPRIRFINLEQNFGEQSGPNNEGVRLSKGRYIAYLNHDDLWFSDHLAKAVAQLEASQADLVFSLVDVVEPDGSRTLFGAAPNGRYEYCVGCVASSWLLRREVLDEVGFWRSARTLHTSPSVDFLRRADQAGKVMRMVPHLTVIVFQSGNRPGVYSRRDSHENQAFFERLIAEPGFREQELEKLALGAASELARVSLRVSLKRVVRSILYRLFQPFGIQTVFVYNILRFRRKGGYIDHLRRIRGLSPLREEQTLG